MATRCFDHRKAQAVPGSARPPFMPSRLCASLGGWPIPSICSFRRWALSKHLRQVFGSGTPTVFCKLAQGCPSAGYPGKTRRGPNPTGVGARTCQSILQAQRASLPCHNPGGWGPAAFTQGSLRRQPWAIVLNGVAVPDQKTRRRIGRTPLFASLREPVFFKPGFAREQKRKNRGFRGLTRMRKSPDPRNPRNPRF